MQSLNLEDRMLADKYTDPRTGEWLPNTPEEVRLSLEKKIKANYRQNKKRLRNIWGK